MVTLCPVVGDDFSNKGVYKVVHAAVLLAFEHLPFQQMMLTEQICEFTDENGGGTDTYASTSIFVSQSSKN